MSYDIIFRDPATGKAIKKPAALLDNSVSSIHAIGGDPAASEQMWMSPTYNYSGIFEKYGIHPKDDLDGKTAAEVAEKLRAAIPRMGDDVNSDYWKATEGNAKRVALRLLAWCALAPEAIVCEES